MPILHWLDKDKHIRKAAQAPYRLLKLDPTLSYGDTDTKNMIIQGDNLDALKALLPYYANSVKCIFIDPPYNTRSAFEHYDDNLEHSKWLEMMYPRLELLRELLAENGVIFVQLDDNEVHYLKVMMDEIFGRKNFINSITIDARAPSSFSTVNPGVFKSSEYILWYAKNKNKWESKTLRIPTNRDKAYNKFVANIEESHQNWKFKSLKVAFLESINTDRIQDLKNIIEKIQKTLKESTKNEIHNFLQQNFKYSVMFNIKNISSQIHSKLAELNNDNFYQWAYDYMLEKISVSYIEKDLDSFVFKNADSVFRFTEISDSGAGQETVELKKQSKKIRGQVFKQKRSGYEDIYILNGQQFAFYRKNVSIIDKQYVATKILTNVWFDISWEGIAKEGSVVFKKSKKPERLIERILHIATNPHDLVLDSFLGSGTTAAVAHKMNRNYIGIEMGEHAKTHCVERLKKVTQGEQGGISKAVNWQGGGGFAFYHLGESIFDDDGRINSDIKFTELSSHIWFSETKTPLAVMPTTPLLGVNNGVAYYLLYNGILGDKRPAGGNVLTSSVFESLPKFEGEKIIYGETCRMGSSRLDMEKIMFKQTPYDIKGR